MIFTFQKRYNQKKENSNSCVHFLLGGIRMVFIMEAKRLDLFLTLLEDMSLDEENRIRLYKKSGTSQMQSLGAHLLSRYAIAQFLNADSLPDNIVITHAASGQPKIVDRQGNPQKIYISCSHTNATSEKNAGIIVCGVSGNPIGVDIEKNRPYLERVVNRMFTQKEIDYIRVSDCKDKTFTILWCLREAYAKLSGLGLAKMPVVEFDLSVKNSFCSDKTVFPAVIDWKNCILAIISKCDEPLLIREVTEENLIYLC